MTTADQLVELMFSWMEQREKSANKLKKLAGELESLREKSNRWQAVGSATALVGSVAGLASLFTGGAAASLLSRAGKMCTGAGFGISLITKLVKHRSESDTMEEAKKAESEGHKITERIQGLFEKLKEECKKTNPNADPDDLDQHAMIEIVGAIAKQSGLNPRFTKTLSQEQDFCGETKPTDKEMNSFLSRLLVELASVLSFFRMKASGKGSKILFAKGAEFLCTLVSSFAKNAVLKRGAMALGGALRLAFELPEAIDHWKDLIEKNNVTEASKSLRDTADALLQLNRTLRAQLDKIKQMLEELDQLKRCVENSNRTSEEKENFIRIVKKYCHKGILNCLNKTDDTEIFFKLVDIFNLLKQELDKKKKKIDREDIDIIFVAHGEIQEPLILARTLLPLSTIEDMILYSPWNCIIDSNVAYGIATGDLQTQHRIFCCRQKCGCSDDERHQPNTLPPNWNSMKNAGGSKIPNILVSPLNHPKDPAWNGILWLEGKFGEPGKNRVVLPYIIPGYDGGDSMKIPFSVVTLALSLVLFIFPFTARVHLAACLGRSPQQTLMKEAQDLEKPYAWTSDHTCMTAKINDTRQDRGLISRFIIGLLRRLFIWFGTYWSLFLNEEGTVSPFKNM